MMNPIHSAHSIALACWVLEESEKRQFVDHATVRCRGVAIPKQLQRVSTIKSGRKALSNAWLDVGLKTC